MESLAIIGTGISGLACAHYLHEKYDITVYEKNNYAGGHTNTVTVQNGNEKINVDTGFMVFNHQTYPHLTRLFNELGVETQKTSMSFSVQHLPTGLEYCGSGLNGLFAQRKNIFNLSFIKMLMQISRFNKESVRILDDPAYQNYSLEEYINKMGYGDDMLWKYLVPMGSAVWSTPMDLMMKFPASTLIRFFKNHGFLGLNTQHQWYTVVNGSASYRDKIILPFKDRILLNNSVVKVSRAGVKVNILSLDGTIKQFDKVIFASHADETLAILETPSEMERKLLSCFKYQANTATLHTDERIMPGLKSAWSSWNYRMDQVSKGKKSDLSPSTIYWMNSLQRLQTKQNYFVSINDPGKIDEKKIIRRINYTHPLFDVSAIKAQADLQKLNETGPMYYCGAWFRYGFHEDGLKSAIDLCRKFPT